MMTEEVNKHMVEEKEKDGIEVPMRAKMMMKRNSDDNEEKYR